MYFMRRAVGCRRCQRRPPELQADCHLRGIRQLLLPCGTCRQVLWEFSPDIEVLCARADGRYVSYPLRVLLPDAFSKEIME